MVVGSRAAHRERRWSRRCDRVFYGGMAVAVAALVFAGFARTFYLRGASFADRPLSPLVLVHGLVFSSWIVLLVAQTSLVAGGRVDLHRRLGRAGMAIAALMIVVGPLTAVAAARRDAALEGAAALRFLLTPLADIVVFGALVWNAFLLRRRSETHKRLMLLAAIALLPPAIARLPLDVIRDGSALPVFALADLPIAGCAAYDLVARGRLHPSLIAGALFIIASQPLRVALSETQAWLGVARWLVG